MNQTEENIKPQEADKAKPQDAQAADAAAAEERPAGDAGDINSSNADAESAKQAQDNAEAEAKVPTPEEVIAELNAKLEKKHNDYLLLYADFENYKKRTFKEKADSIWITKKALFEDMLPVVDDFERGLKEIDKADADSLDSLKEGVVNIYRKFSNFLSMNDVKVIDTADRDFDTDFHEAVAIVPMPGKENKVIDCTQKGYTLGGKVMRHAKVVVGKSN